MYALDMSGSCLARTQWCLFLIFVFGHEPLLSGRYWVMFFFLSVDKWKKNLFGNQFLTRFTAETFTKYFANFFCFEKLKFLHAFWTNGLFSYLFFIKNYFFNIIYLYSWIFFEYTGFARWKFSTYKKFPFYIKLVYKK